MKAVCEALGLARSHIHALKHRPASWVDGRKRRTPACDEQLLIDIREHIAELPSYGYRRACALLNRERTRNDRPRVNPKRVYRVTAAKRAATRSQSARLIQVFMTPLYGFGTKRGKVYRRSNLYSSEVIFIA